MRIITGSAKGLKLKTPANNFTRPTSDRVKESLFSVLSNIKNFYEIESVLDIFAGTGALALESISRGAGNAIMIDNATADIISDNVRRAKFENVCKVYRGDFMKILKKISKQDLKFDLIFSDPPYNKGLAQISINLAAEFELLKSGGILTIEHGADEDLIVPKNFKLLRKIVYGHTTAIEIFELRKESEL